MKILGIIPARGGSKGVKLKNIRQLNGKPLIYYTIKAAQDSKRMQRFVVSTDSPQIADISRQYGAEVPFLRPYNLATDEAKSIPVLQHALNEIETIDGVSYDGVLMLQPTTPFRMASDIDQAIGLMEKTDCDSVISVVEVGAHHPARMKFIEDGRLIDPQFCEEYENQPRQELPQMFIRNGAIYLTKRNVLFENGLKGKNCLALLMPANRSINIDALEDFEYSEWRMQRTQE